MAEGGVVASGAEAIALAGRSTVDAASEDTRNRVGVENVEANTVPDISTVGSARVAMTCGSESGRRKCYSCYMT